MSVIANLFGTDADIVGDRNLQVLMLADVVTLMGTVVLSPILDSLIAPFGTSAAAVGRLISVFTVPAILGIPVAGGLAALGRGRTYSGECAASSVNDNMLAQERPPSDGGTLDFRCIP